MERVHSELLHTLESIVAASLMEKVHCRRDMFHLPHKAQLNTPCSADPRESHGLWVALGLCHICSDIL